MKTTIIGVILKNRLEDAIEFQKIITTYGCDIKTRVGLHPVQKDTCVNSGIVLLEVLKNAEKLIKELKEKLFNQKELGWNSINDREKEAIYTFSNGYMNFLNKAKIERENRKRS